ncbi:MAG TPA: NUDIX domain-containing protein [Kiritimatiellia bacterium]|nr:NUDIX domain-containing protein [Kiritimatiellia bacterium]HPS07100.1 NUDIX domain-containing protein [Kiritimatiellia bacterium]
MKKSTSLLIQDEDGQYLLIRRCKTCNNFKEWWEFPGGKLDGDESPADAIIREVREETGIIAPRPDPATGVLIGVANGSVQYTFFAWKCGPRPKITLSDEHEDFKWVSFTEARKIDKLMCPHREFLERRWHRQQIRAYESLQARYETFANTLRTVLERLKDRWTPLSIVQARAKTLSSFAEKCLRKADKYNDPANQLTDLCGGRIVCPTTDDADTVCRQIRSLFAPVDEDDNTATRHKTDSFGYLSVHFIVHFPEGMNDMLGVPIPPEIVGLKGEIQVRTLLQHAHSEVTHDRLYKSGFKAPEHCRREAARVAAMLESGDEQFARFVHQLDAYVGHYAAHMSPVQRRREIADLLLVLSHEPKDAKKPPLALRIARLCRAGWDWQGVAAALEPFASATGLSSQWISVELGNALCRLHCDTPQGAEFRRGLRLLEAVAKPAEGTSAFLEAAEKDLRATALAWLGSALSKQTGHRAEARTCLSKAVELAPEDPYHLTAFVELDVIATGTCGHIDLLAPALKQASGRCAEHIRAGIEVTRAWLTICKIRLLLGDETGTLEALCLAARLTESPHPLADFHHSLDVLKDAISGCRPFISLLYQATLLLAAEKTLLREDAEPEKPNFTFQSEAPVLILAGSTDAQSEALLAAYEAPLQDALATFSGTLVTGGTGAGICGLAARCSAHANASGTAHSELVGYLPARAEASSGFSNIVRTGGANFSLLEPLQMWSDLLASGIKPASVTLLCLGGGEISAQELALAWALGARVAALAGDSVAPKRFSALLASAGTDAGRGMILPDDPATLRAFIPFDKPIDAARWEIPGQIIHDNYVSAQHKKVCQPNLLPWTLLRDDLKHSNRHQAACSVAMLQQCGFGVREADRSRIDPSKIVFAPEEVEHLSELEHGRWNVERLNNGWRRADKKNEALKLSPYLVAWRELPDDIKAYDRDAIRNWPATLAQAGLEVYRI